MQEINAFPFLLLCKIINFELYNVHQKQKDTHI